MAIRRITGFAGAHPLDGPGWFNGARVVNNVLAGAVSISARSQSSGQVFVNTGFAAGAAVGAAIGGAGQLPNDAQLVVTLRNAADAVDVDFVGPYG